MAYVIGIVIASFVALLARVVRLDRDRAFYPTVLIVIASYYVLFAAMAGSLRAIAVESAVMTLFAIVAIVGFRFNAWLVAAALFAHGIFDFFHGSLITNGGVPVWWPAFCLGYDVAAAVAVAIIIKCSPASAREAPAVAVPHV